MQNTRPDPGLSKDLTLAFQDSRLDPGISCKPNDMNKITIG
jgi:hypothetical protein